MLPEFQKQYKTMDAYSIVLHLREPYNEQVRTKRFKVYELIFSSKMEEGTIPMQHALKMYEHIERLNQLGYWMDFELSVDLILARLPDSSAQFVLDYRIDFIVSNILELVTKIAEEKLAQKKGKETAPKETCFYCEKVGHWKRNYKAYMESKKKVACDAPSSLGVYVIKVNIVSPNNTWVYDTSCGSIRKLTKGEFDLQVGNDARVADVAIWTYVLNLPSGLCLNLDDCCFVPTLMKKFFQFLI